MRSLTRVCVVGPFVASPAKRVGPALIFEDLPWSLTELVLPLPIPCRAASRVRTAGRLLRTGQHGCGAAASRCQRLLVRFARFAVVHVTRVSVTRRIVCAQQPRNTTWSSL